MILEKARQIDGWMSESELSWLANVAQHCDHILEFGCYKGRSTRVLADNCRGKIYAVDPWDGVYHNNDGSRSNINTAVSADFNRNLADLIESGKVVPFKDYSWAIRFPVRFDLVFIDGDHRYEEVKGDILIALRFVKPRGMIAGHDYGRSDWPGVKQAVDEFFPSAKISDTIWFTLI